MTIVILARHGETDWNSQGRWQGWADPPLNERGRQQAAALAERLRETPFDAVYTSDLRRAHETAEIVARPHGVPVVADPGLREIDVGSWSGLTRAEIDERFGGERPDGETREQHRARVRAAAERLVRAHGDERILLVSHGGTMRALADAFDGPIANCGTIELRWADGRLAAV
ncbi:MAG TPA: histidine phosphatase family protein [Gaiellaceae bacterium]